NFAAAKAITGTSGSVAGRNTGATVQAGEPFHDGVSTGPSVWYTYTAPSAGVLKLDTCTAVFDTVLAVYTGTAVNALTPVVANDDACGSQSRVGTALPAGKKVYIAVAGFESEQAGSFKLTYSFTPGGVAGPPSLTTTTAGDGWASIAWAPPVFTG